MPVNSRLSDILPCLTASLQIPFRKMNPETAAEIQELRLRRERPLHAVRGGTEYAVTESGALTGTGQKGCFVSGQALDTVFRNCCAHSVHSYQHEIVHGYLTASGGNRVGICGTAVLQNGCVTGVRDISGLNIRIASERTGCAEPLAAMIGDPRRTGGVLLCGSPASGKTTILRDLARIFGNRMRVCILDERGELAATRNGIPQFDVGTQTDVFDGYPKAEAVEQAVRVMSPEVLICDELGGRDEADRLLQMLHTGVRLIASAHAESFADLFMRQQMKRLIDEGIFHAAYLLGTGRCCGEIAGIHTFGGQTCKN